MRRVRGLTLIEVLLALALAAILLATVVIFVQDLVRARDRLGATLQRERAVDAFIEALEQAIASCVLDSSDGGFRGTPISCDLRAATTDPMQVFEPRGTPFPATVGAWFGLEESDGSLRVRLGSVAEESLPAKVFALRLRYHDGAEWVDHFDGAERRRLPAAVEVSVWMAPWPDGARPPWMPEPTTPEPAARWDDGIRESLASAMIGQATGPDGSAGGAASRGPSTLTGVPDAVDAAPAPDRRRIIIVPDSAPAALTPSPRRRAS